MNETEAWIKNVVQVQLPDIPSSGLGELLDSKESKEFLQDMNTISLYISYSKVVISNMSSHVQRVQAIEQRFNNQDKR